MSYNEFVDGDLANNQALATSIPLSSGSTFITGQTSSNLDKDFFTFVVPTGSILQAFFLLNHSGGDDNSYFGLTNGGPATSNDLQVNPTLVGALVDDELNPVNEEDFDLLDFGIFNGTSNPLTGPQTLGPGTYTGLFQEISGLPNPNIVNYQFKAVLATGGADDLFGQSRGDRLNGLGGNDNFFGRNGNDTLNGDAGNDTIRGEDGNDSLDGGTGNDSLLGGTGTDTLLGQGGADTLRGGDGGDLLDSDTENTIDAIGDLLDGGAGNDTLRGEAGGDTLEGGSGNDSLVGDDNAGGFGNDSLLGGTGNDTLRGEEGNDTLKGEANNDSLFGGAGADNLKGQDGNDTLFGEGNNDTVNGGTGNDRVNAGGGNDLVAGISGQDLLNGSLGNDEVFGGADRDTLLGAHGNDTLVGGDDIDFLNGTINSVRGVGERDFLSGGAGNDRYILGSAVLPFYLDAGAGGTSFATLQDFGGGDRIILHGSSVEYRLAVSGGNTFILFREPGPDDAIALIENTVGLNLNSNKFIYV